MRRISQFAELINAGGAFVEFYQRGIDRGEVLNGVRTAETAEPCKRRGRRVHRQQVQDATTQCVDDVRQMLNQLAQLPGRRNDRVTLFVELRQLGFERR